MKKALILILVLLLYLGLTPVKSLAAEGIKDINGHWAQAQIERWADDGLITGYTDGQFKPDEPITRAEFVSLVNRAYNIEKKDSRNPFSDVKPPDWFFGEVLSGKAAGYIAGYPDGTFKPHNNISRQEAAVIIVKLLNLAAEEEEGSMFFTDYPNVDQWAQGSIRLVIAHGIMSGFPDNTFKAKNNITRAETVAALNRSLSFREETIPDVKDEGVDGGGGNKGNGNNGGNGGNGDNAGDNGNGGNGDNSGNDPAAPVNDRTVATSLFSSTAFLYSGDDPVQIGMAPNTIEQKQAAVIRGRILTRDDEPLSGVKISVLDHTEFGCTLSGSNGCFDMAVNGGDRLTVNYEKEGYITAQRQIDVPWQDFAVLPEVVLIPYDSNNTVVSLTPASPMQVARGSEVTDADGSRQATLIIPAGVTAKLEDGTPISNLTVRATEYTVGANGPKAMPAILPPNVAYTYCVEYSVDEAIAAGAKSVIFDEPIYHYVENFIGFPVGGIVPMGYYDYDQAAWIPSENGQIIKILRIGGDGKAVLDIDGSGFEANHASLEKLGVTDEERQKLAAIYKAGQELWRVPITHFSPWDCNWPFGPPLDARGPQVPMPEINRVNDPCLGRGSIIEYQNQALGEEAMVYGTPFSLNYNSSRAEGSKQQRSLEIPISGADLPASLKEILLEVRVAGRFFSKRFKPVSGQNYIFTWDGKNPYGQTVQGTTPIHVRIGYVYNARYYEPQDNRDSNAFGNYGEPFPVQWKVSRESATFTAWQDWYGMLSFWDSAPAGIGGWSLNVHHAYDPGSGMLFLGDGSRTDAGLSENIISNVAGTSALDTDEDGFLDGGFSGDNGSAGLAQLDRPFGVATGPDGSIFIADGFNKRIRKISPNGIITTIAGNPAGNELDNGPAKLIKIGMPMSIALGPDGSIYFAEDARHRIRKIDPEGSISVVAGTGSYGLSGDGGPAKLAQLNAPGDIALAPDGSIYIADANNHRIRRIDPNGIITTIAGTGTGSDGGGFAGDGGPASLARLKYPNGIAIGSDGVIYIADSGNNCVRRIEINGVITTVAGNGNSLGGFSGDGGPAVKADLNSPQTIMVTSDGTIFITDYRNHRIRKVTSDGIIRTVAGTETPDKNGDGSSDGGYDGDGDFASEAQLCYPSGIALSPDGSLYIADTHNHRIRRVGQPSMGNLANEYLIADQGGGQLFAFDSNGRHFRTINALTGSDIYTFSYNDNGQLAAVTDAFDNVTAIVRDAEGNPTEIVASGGQKTYLKVNANGYLSSISCPYEIPINLSYGNGNLLTMFSDHKGNVYRFSYDEMGLLIKDENPAGGFTELSRTKPDKGYQVNVKTAEGRKSIYKVENIPGVGTRMINTDSAGGKTIMEVYKNGTRNVTYPDGTVAVMLSKPDPRPGIEMRAPFTGEFLITTPKGLVSTITKERSLEFADGDANNLFNITKITDKVINNGNTYTTTYELDKVGKKVIVTDLTPLGRQKVSTLDWYGRIEKVSIDGLEPTVYSYDEKGRLIKIQKGEQSLGCIYDNMNRLISLTDAEGAEFRYTYNDADILKSITMPGGQTYAFGNDYNGNVTGITIPGGEKHQLSYTAIDQPESYTPPGNAPYQKSYDKDRALTQMLLPDGREVSFIYDSEGRIIGINCEGVTSVFAYTDSTDRVTTISRNSGSPDGNGYFFGYDGALITQVIGGDSVATDSYSYRYNNDFSLAGFTLNDASEVAFTYDDDGLLTRYGDFDIEHGGQFGAPSQISDGTMTTDYTYDAYGRMASLKNSVGGKSVYSLDIIFDKSGIIRTKTERIGHSADKVYSYTYDENKQLTGAAVDGTPKEAYTYDANGNRLTDEALYDEQGRLIRLNGVDYRFNADGFLTQRGLDTFDYTAQGELRQAVAGGREISYTYDGMGRRIGRSVNTGTEEAPIIEEEQYLYGDLGNPFRITAMRDSSGVLSQYYYDQSNCLFAIQKGDKKYYVATDQQGTPKIVCDSDGTLVKIMEYDSYGELISDSNPSFRLPIGYAGGISDTDTKLVHFGMRDYDPDAGRWTARDPILFDGYQGNLYVYVGNNPVNLRDPSGLFCIGGSAYAIFGGGGQFCINGEGISVCAEVGFGAGTSVEINPFQGLAETGSEFGLQLGVGPASGELTLDDCGNLMFSAGLGIGPFSKSVSYDFLGGKWGFNDISVGIDPADFFETDDKSSKTKIDVSGKIYGKKCLKIH